MAKANITWDSFNTVLFDGDHISVSIEENAVGSNIVQFILESAPNSTWWKGIQVPDGLGSSWEIWTQDDKKSDRVELWADQVNNGQLLEFKKAKKLGIHTGMYWLGELERLKPGTRVIFHWAEGFIEVGEFVPTKFLWLLDMVEVEGIARNIGGDDFDIVPDPNYRHLISYIRGNNPLPWQRLGSPGVLHCETYIQQENDPNSINRVVPWPLPGKPAGQPFEVTLRDGSKRSLVEGDHVRVVGRWVMDHHPEYCIDPTNPEKFDPPEPSRCRDRGWLRVGQSHVELHPVLWNDIRVVEPLRPEDVSAVILSLAAPLHEEQYLGGGKWFGNEVAGVSGKVFIADDDLSNFHETVAASIKVPAPELPANWSDVWREIHYEEHVIKIGHGLVPSMVRSITVMPEAIEVQASLTAHSPRPGQHASITDPALDYSIFQARYDVWWKFIGARISCVNKPNRSDPDQHIDAVGGVLPNGMPWKLPLAEAVALVKRGHRFYVEQPVGDRVGVVIERSRYGKEYLKTVADNEKPNNLLELPECA